jgi:hypothetical protein
MRSLRRLHISVQNAFMRFACTKFCMHQPCGPYCACEHVRPADIQAMVPVPRFAASLASKMAREEYQGLRNRTAVQTDGRMWCICLVAVSPDEGVCGSLDLRLPAEVSGHYPPGVPEVLLI